MDRGCLTDGHGGALGDVNVSGNKKKAMVTQHLNGLNVTEVFTLQWLMVHLHYMHSPVFKETWT